MNAFALMFNLSSAFGTTINLICGIGILVVITGFLLKKINQPSLVSYILIGVLIGSHGLDFIEQEETMRFIGELGIVLLFFFIGMEIDLSSFVRDWKIAVFGTLAQILFSILLVYTLGQFIGWNRARSIVLGCVIALSSSAVIFKLLEEGKKVLIIGSAQPNNYYKAVSHFFKNKGAEIIDKSCKKNLNWGIYDCLVILGGDTVALKNHLISIGFSTSKLKKNLLVIGDSAGAMIMAEYFYDYNRKNKKITFKKGFLTTNKQIIAVHVDNLNYYDDFSFKKVNEFAKEKGLQVMALKENQQVEVKF